MDSRLRQYLFGLVFFGFGVYEFKKNDPLEAAVYLTAGLAFIFNNLVGEPKLVAYRKPLIITTWALIIAASIIFLYVLQFKFL
jgi:DMSO/TMAO reductase YedYZ heme-binding membrane subunit